VRRTQSIPPLAQIRRVIDARDVRIVYQPIVDLRTRQTYAFEALVRSKDPSFATPQSLFAAAIDASCVGELGRLLREMSIANCEDYPLFLNIHPAELNERYVVQMDDPIFRHNHDVFLEITEGVPLSHFELCKSILTEVRGRGIYLVVDDLGAGYSNLKYIADLQPRVVKLDRELIAGLTTDSRRFKLVSAIVVMCRELDALVVAEGIETVPELEAVLASGARYGQGYLLARPAFPLPCIEWPEVSTQRRATSRIAMRRIKQPTRRPR
jgi:EAL domain-containing protein (putative c-di-GMP-specific phosphodiesterase class I)